MQLINTSMCSARIPESISVKAPSSDELTQLTHTIAQRIGRYLERQNLLVRDAVNSYFTAESVDTIIPALSISNYN